LVLATIDGTADMVGLVLWVGMLARDAPEVAEATAKRFVARPRVLHYWEEEGWPVSTRLRPVLGRGPYDPTRSAWDVYLLYGRGIQWGDGNPPVPTAWAYNTRDDLPSGARLSAALIRDWMHD
jgi:hypothetical protein